MMGSARFFITLFIAFQTFNHGFSDNSTLCNSDVCHKLSKYLYSLMNPVVNPCDNFYQFTCGGYLAANKQVPLGSDFIGVEDISSEIVYKAVLDGLHLVKSNSKKVSKAFKYAKRYFEHCTEYDPKDEGNQNEVVDYLLKFTKWPFTEKNWNEEDFDPVELVARLQAELQLPTLAEMKISQDKLDNEHMTVYLKEGALLYPVQRFNDSLFPEFREKYIDSIFKAFEQLAINAKVTHWNVKKFKKVAREIYEFESDLAKFIEPTDDESENDIFKFYNPLTMAQLNMIYNSSTVWQTYFKTTVGNDERTLKWLDENRIIVTQLRYFVSLADKLVNTKPEVVANYLMWRLLAYLGPYFDNEFMIIEGVPMSEDHSKNPKLKESVKKTPKELGDCLVETMKVFPYVAGRIYVDSRFSNSKLESSLNITQSIKDAVREMFSENTWLSKEAKRRIFEKLDNMVLNIGYPEWILNNTELNEHYKRHRIRSNGTSFFKNQLIMKRFKTDDLFETVNRHRFTLDVTEINNAQYNADMNALTVPAAQFEIPFFDPEYPDFHNFATVGFTVGHEIFHGFDTTGALYDAFGNATLSHELNTSWLLENSAEEFERLAKCLELDYDHYCYNFTSLYNNTEDETLDTLIMNNCVAGETTLGENIADLNGLHAALKAYSKRAELKKNSNLQGFDHFSHEQMFFISYGSAWCNRLPSNSVSIKKSMIEEHSPHDARVNALLRNFPEFQEAFQCKPEDFMSSNSFGSYCSMY